MKYIYFEWRPVLSTAQLFGVNCGWWHGRISPRWKQVKGIPMNRCAHHWGNGRGSQHLAMVYLINLADRFWIVLSVIFRKYTHLPGRRDRGGTKNHTEKCGALIEPQRHLRIIAFRLHMHNSSCASKPSADDYFYGSVCRFNSHISIFSLILSG